MTTRVQLWRVVDAIYTAAPTFSVEMREASVWKDGCYKLDKPFSGLLGVVFGAKKLGLLFSESHDGALRDFAARHRRHAETSRKEAVAADAAAAWAEQQLASSAAPRTGEQLVVQARAKGIFYFTAQTGTISIEKPTVPSNYYLYTLVMRHMDKVQAAVQRSTLGSAGLEYEPEYIQWLTANDVSKAQGKDPCSDCDGRGYTEGVPPSFVPRPCHCRTH